MAAADVASNMATVLSCIEEKYADDDAENYGFIVFVSNSPECKKGMFPPIMTLCDYDIQSVGERSQARAATNRLPFDCQPAY